MYLLRKMPEWGMTSRVPQIKDGLWTAYRYRLKRRKYLWRAFRGRRALTALWDNTDRITPGDILLVAVLRNEARRLPAFMDHYRQLGVGHFLIVDNASTDDSLSHLKGPDISVWQTQNSYRASRFGVDWSNWLLTRYGHKHWCLSVDLDELLVYPEYGTRRLPDLTGWLDDSGRQAYGAFMLDMFPNGPVGKAPFDADPIAALPWFDAGPFRVQRQDGLHNLWMQGGTRDRVFFADTPERAPTLNKIPLVKWRRGYAYVNSAHSMLPRDLNYAYDGPWGTQPGGVLLHTKFLNDICDRSAQERQRAEHFTHPQTFDDYYDALTASPDLWHSGAIEYTGWKQLNDLCLFAPGTWQQ